MSENKRTPFFSQQAQKFPKSFPLRVVNRFNKISARVNSFNQFAADMSFQEKEVSHAMFGEIHSLLHASPRADKPKTFALTKSKSH